MKYYIRITTTRDIYLLTKIPDEECPYALERVLYERSVDILPGPFSLCYYPEELVEFDTEEDAIAYAALEIL